MKRFQNGLFAIAKNVELLLTKLILMNLFAVFRSTWYIDSPSVKRQRLYIVDTKKINVQCKIHSLSDKLFTKL